jgi:hypothetical protein
MGGMKNRFLLIIVLGFFSASAFSINLPLIKIKSVSGYHEILEAVKEECNNNYACNTFLSLEDQKTPLTIKWTCTGSSTIYSQVNIASELDLNCEKAIKFGGHSEKEFPSKGKPKRPANTYTYSYKAMALSSKDNKFKQWVGEDCIDTLKTLFASGKKLTSEILGNHIEVNPADKNTFYHYTFASIMNFIAKKNRPLDMFEHLRTTTSPWLSTVYVADDSESSSQFGNMLFKIILRGEIKVLNEDGYPQPLEKKGSLSEIVVEDLINREPKLAYCKAGKSLDNQAYIPLYFLVAEEMGVDMIHYSWPEANGHWFQILNPYAVDHLERIK